MKTMQKIATYFEFTKHKTNFRTEILAGLSTFLALSYIFVVNPAILGEAGMNKSAVLFATIVASSLATLAMGLWAKKPFVLAPGMEMNAYVAFFVVIGLGFSWQQALGAVFWSGIMILVLTLLGIRKAILEAIPDKMKSGLALCVGVFLMLIALRLAGIIIYEGVRIDGMGIVFSPLAYVFYFGLASTLLLRKIRTPGAVLISIILSSIAAHFLGVGGVGETVHLSKEMFSAILKLDFGVILNPSILGVILVLFIIDFYGSVAKFIGLSRNTSIVTENKELPQMNEALIVDGGANSVGALLGTTSPITYVESAVGIAEGGRTGFTAVVCAALMMLFIVLTPLLNLVPLIATTGALFWVGLHLTPSMKELKAYTALDKATVMMMIVAVVATFALDKALLVGFLVYLGGMVVAKRFCEINKYTVISAVLLLIAAGFSVL